MSEASEVTCDVERAWEAQVDLLVTAWYNIQLAKIPLPAFRMATVWEIVRPYTEAVNKLGLEAGRFKDTLVGYYDPHIS